MSQWTIRAEPVKIEWNPNLPVFAKGEFLSAVGDEYGWLGGFDESETIRCILPFTILRKAGVRMVRFRNQTIPWGGELDLPVEKAFLNSVIQYFRSSRADVIIPPTNNTVFRTYPDGAKPAPYGTYVIDLLQSEDVLWRNISKGSRRDIISAQEAGFVIHDGMESLDPAYDLIRDTFRRSQISFMSHGSFRRFALALGEHGKLFMAENDGVVHSYSLFAFSAPSAYWIYGGNIRDQHRGAMKLLQWEAIRYFRKAGVEKFDCFGARINPQKGSKQEGINLMKKHLGATLSQGYIWKYALGWRAHLYSAGVQLLRGGDIVDQECFKLKECVGAVA